MVCGLSKRGEFQGGAPASAIARGIVRAGLPVLGCATAGEFDKFVTERLTASSADGSLDASLQAQCTARTGGVGICDIELAYPTAFQKFEYPTLRPTPVPSLLPTATSVQDADGGAHAHADA